MMIGVSILAFAAEWIWYLWSGGGTANVTMRTNDTVRRTAWTESNKESKPG